MAKRFFYVAAGAFLLAVGGPGVFAIAAPTAPASEAQQVRVRDWQDRGFRLREAVKYREAFTQLNNQIPTLSPEQERWLQTEVDEDMARAGHRYTKRALAAMESREYHTRVAKSGTQKVLRILDALADGRPKATANEVMLWTTLASAFMDHTMWQGVGALVQAQVVDVEVDGVKDFYFENHVLWAQELLDEVVVPYLRRAQ